MSATVFGRHETESDLLRAALDMSGPVSAGAVTPADAAVSPLPVMLLISSLEHGGAERQVVELVRHLDRRRFAPFVCSLASQNPLAETLPDPSRDLVVVEKRWKYDVSTIGRVAELMRQRGVGLVHAFLFDAEMVARLAAPRAGGPVVIASERNTDYRWPVVHWLGMRLTRSRFDVMIANSSAGKRFNERTLGIDARRIAVVHNGVDVARFRPQDRMAVRGELGIGPDEFVVGMIAMFKRQKNHGDFFRMAKAIAARHPRSWFLCAGEPLRDNQQGADDYYREIRVQVRELGLTERCRFVGNRNDMPAVYSACDVTVLPSRREGTPNVLLESMACGVPVVATDVADNAYVVPDGRVGFIVPLDEVESLTQRVAYLLENPELRASLGHAARTWVEREFSIAALVQKTATVYEDAIRARRLAGGGRD